METLVLSLAPDLMARSKIDVAARHYGVPVRHAADGAEFLRALGESPAWRLVLLDADMEGIDAPALVRAAKAAAPGARVVACCSHVLVDLIRATRQAGADAVVANSTFFAGIPGYFAPLADRAALGLGPATTQEGQ